jgi:hypothetical protein
MAWPTDTSFVFSDPVTTDFIYSEPVHMRSEVYGQDRMRVSKIAVASNITLGSATKLTFRLESAPTEAGPWTTSGYLAAPTIASSVAVSELCELQWTRSAAGQSPALCVEPDNEWIRLAVKADGAGASLTAAYYVSQK